MQRIWWVFILGLFLVPGEITAQITFKGKLMWAETLTPAISVVIADQDMNLLDTTDFDGGFECKLAEKYEWLYYFSGEFAYQWFPNYRRKVQWLKKDKAAPIVNVVLIQDGNPGLGRLSPNPVANVRSWEIDQDNQASLQTALNNEPGVNMQSRGPGGSRRLSLRGSLLRSPFGVRNVRMWWNGLPLSDPDGTTALELADPEWVEDMEIEKGPGDEPGMAGKIQLNNAFLRGNGWVGSAGYSRGSYGFDRITIDFHRLKNASRETKKSGIRVGYIHQNSAGYREQEANRKDQILVQAFREVPFWGRFSFFGTLYDGYWELPGSVDSLAFETQPTSANSYSVAHDAHVQRRRLRAGVNWDRRFKKNRWARASIYGDLTDKENPYGTSLAFQGYKFESGGGWGAKAAMGRYIQFWDGVGMRWETSLTFQWQRNNFSEFVNDSGAVGSLKFADRINSTYLISSTTAKFQLGDFWALTSRLGINYVGNQIDNQFSASGVDHSLSRNYLPLLAPSVGLSRYFLPRTIGFLNASYGFSPPAAWEFYNSDGSTNEGLRTEKGTNIEAGIRTKLFKERVIWWASIYQMNLFNVIVPFVDDAGRESFVNSGRTVQRGLESTIKLSRATFQEGDGYALLNFLDDWQVKMTGAWQPYKFSEFVIDGENFAGKQLPGVSSWTGTLAADLDFSYRLFLTGSLQFYGPSWIDNENSHLRKAFTLMNLKTGWTKYSRSGNSLIRLEGGVQNLLNVRYNSFPSLNAFGDRFYNAGMPRNIFLGLIVKFLR